MISCVVPNVANYVLFLAVIRVDPIALGPFSRCEFVNGPWRAVLFFTFGSVSNGADV